MARKPIVKKDALDHLAEGDPKDIIAAMLWKARHHYPSLSMELTEKDLKGLNDCVTYLKVKPEVLIVRPQGRPAQAPQPAVGQRRAVPGFDAEPPRPFVVVALVEKGTANAIRAVENNVEDNERRIMAEAVAEYRARAGQIAANLENIVRTKDFSESDLREAAAALRTLAQAAGGYAA